MFKRVVRLFMFGILGMIFHSIGIVAQEQGEEVLLPLPKPMTSSQDSILMNEFTPENKELTDSEGAVIRQPRQEANKPLKIKLVQPKLIKKDDSQSNLSFNFLYYIFYKFKPSDVLEKK
ncbi:MAG: hypothetical protein ACJAXX_000021 [Roseivirga sp.]|jgi:hypothetical protein